MRVMASSGSCCTNDGDNNSDSLMKWPLEYVRKAKEYVCGWCGQLLSANPTHDDLEIHFKSCKKSKESEFSMVFKELIKINRKFEGLDADIQKKVDKMKAEVMEEVLDVETKVRKEIEDKKTELKTEILKLKSEIMESEKLSVEASYGTLPNLFSKVKALEEGMKEKMAEVKGRVSEVNGRVNEVNGRVNEVNGRVNEVNGRVSEVNGRVKKVNGRVNEVNGRVSGVTEAISTVVESIAVKEKEATSSTGTLLFNEQDRSKKETEALWVQLRKSEGAIESLKTQVEDNVARLKTGTETLSEQMKSNVQELQVQQKQMEDERAKNELAKNFYVEPSPFDQLAIPMNCFNLVAHNYLFQPSFRWTIEGIKSKLAQKTLELTSEMFQWNGYPVQARAKLELKEDGYVYLSLCLKDALENEAKDFKPIPQVFYLLKDLKATRKHACQAKVYESGSVFTYSLACDLKFANKSWLQRSTYNVDDSVEIEIHVEPSPKTQLVHSYDGTLEWKIENYAKRLQLEKDSLVSYQESPYFYTSPRRYRAQVRVCLNGEKGGGPTAQIWFSTGKFDADLNPLMYFQHSTTLTLINSKDPGRSIEKTIDSNFFSKTEFEMCKVEEVDNFIENDTLFCKVIIKAR